MARSDELALMFAKPTVAVHRRFEVCRAYFMEHLTAGAIAERFGLHVGSVQVMVRDFAADPKLDHFFVSNRPGRKTSPKREAIAQRVAALRREGKTLGQIRLCLQEDGYEISESYLGVPEIIATSFPEIIATFGAVISGSVTSRRRGAMGLSTARDKEDDQDAGPCADSDTS